LSGTQTWDVLFSFEEITAVISKANAPAFAVLWLSLTSDFKVFQNTRAISIVKCIRNATGTHKGRYSMPQFR